MQGEFPTHLQKYSESPTFDQDTIPPALQRDHNTKAGVWGRIVVTRGTLLYFRPDRPAQIVTPENSATIYPEELHSVTPKGDVTFKVEFYREENEGEAA